MGEPFTEQAMVFVARIADLGATAVILVGLIRALIVWIIHYVRHGESIESVRSGLGWALVLGLEFLVAADVLSTAVAPTWNKLGQVGIIIVLRIVLAYFLEQELQRAGT